MKKLAKELTQADVGKSIRFRSHKDVGVTAVIAAIQFGETTCIEVVRDTLPEEGDQITYSLEGTIQAWRERYVFVTMREMRVKTTRGGTQPFEGEMWERLPYNQEVWIE